MEAEQDKMVIEAAKASGSMDQVLAEWQVNCQVLPKGVYYHKEKKAFVATICITPSRFTSMYHGPGRNSKKYDGPSRKTAEEALADRERMAAAKDEEELLQILREIRGPHARGEKKTGHPAEVVPQGVYYKPDTGTYQAQVSVNRKNVRGPPRTSLQEAIVDRQRLLIAKANNQAEQESLELKMEYQRRVSMEGTGVSPSMVGMPEMEQAKKRGRPRGSMGIARRSMSAVTGAGLGGAGGAFDFNHHFPVLADPSGGNPAFSLFIASTAAAAAAANPNNPLPMSLLFPPTNANFMTQFLPDAGGNGNGGLPSTAMLPSTELLLGALTAASAAASGGDRDNGSPSSKRIKKEHTHSNTSDTMPTNNN
jgi:hypothetical protein